MALFTTETAREYAAKSAAKRREIALIEERAENVETVQAEIEQVDADNFRQLRLGRVRAQLNQIDKAITEELKSTCDAAKLDRLASAAARLNEQERQLSNRSLPPTLKGETVKSRKPAANIEPE